jgi:hypothetical protein
MKLQAVIQNFALCICQPVFAHGCLINGEFSTQMFLDTIV